MKELFEAIRAGDSSRVAALVEADPSLAIFAAAIMGETARIEELLTGNRSLVSLLSTDGWTPLHLAAFFGKTDAARLLLNKGAPVNARSTNPMQNMPLHAAAAGKHAEIVKLLLDHGAPPTPASTAAGRPCTRRRRTAISSSRRRWSRPAPTYPRAPITIRARSIWR